jgi:hypothetical protein
MKSIAVHSSSNSYARGGWGGICGGGEGDSRFLPSGGGRGSRVLGGHNSDADLKFGRAERVSEYLTDRRQAVLRPLRRIQRPICQRSVDRRSLLLIIITTAPKRNYCWSSRTKAEPPFPP